MVRISSIIINYIAISFCYDTFVIRYFGSGHFGFKVLTYDLFMTKYPMTSERLTAVLLDDHLIFCNTYFFHSVVAIMENLAAI